MAILKHKLFTPIFLCLLLATFLIYLVFSGASQDLYSEKLSDTNPIINYSKLNIQHKEKTIKIKLDNGYEIEIAKSKLHNIISEIHNEKNNILKQFYEENQVQIERILSQAKPSITTELADWNYDINRLNTHIFYNVTSFITKQPLEERILNQYEHILTKHLSEPLSQIDYHFSQRKIRINEHFTEKIHQILRKYVVTGDIHIFDGQTINLEIQKSRNNEAIAQNLFQSISSSIDSNLSLSKNMIGEAGLITFVLSSVNYRGKIVSLASKIPTQTLNKFIKTHFVKFFTFLNILILIISLIKMPKSLSGISIGILVGFMLAIIFNMVGIIIQDQTSRKEFESNITNILNNSQNRIITEFNNELDSYYSALEDNIRSNFNTVK